MINLNAKGSYLTDSTNVLSGPEWCGRWILETKDDLGNIYSETIDFTFDFTNSVVTPSVAMQLMNLGVINYNDLIGQPIACIIGIEFGYNPPIVKFNYKLQVYDCNNPLPEDCEYYAEDSKEITPPVTIRESTVNDNDLRNVQLSPTGSLACDGTLISDFSNHCLTTTLYAIQGDRDFDNLGNTISINYTGSPVEIVTISNCNCVLSFDWSNSFITNSIDQALIESQFACPNGADGSITFNKYVIDDIIVGLDEAENTVGSGTDYYGSLGYPRKTVNGYNYYEGGEWYFSNATITDNTGGPCDGLTSSVNTDILPIKKGIKASSYRRHTVGFWDDTGNNNSFKPTVIWQLRRFPTDLVNILPYKPVPEPIEWFIEDGTGDVYGNAFTNNANAPQGTNNLGGTGTSIGQVLPGTTDGKYTLTIENTWADGKLIYNQSLWYQPLLNWGASGGLDRYRNYYNFLFADFGSTHSLDDCSIRMGSQLGSRNFNPPSGITQPWTPLNQNTFACNYEYYSNGVLRESGMFSAAPSTLRSFYPSTINIDQESEIILNATDSQLPTTTPPADLPWNGKGIKSNMRNYIIRTF